MIYTYVISFILANWIICPLSVLCDSTVSFEPGAIDIGCDTNGPTCDDACAFSIGIEPTSTGIVCVEIFVIVVSATVAIF